MQYDTAKQLYTNATSSREPGWVDLEPWGDKGSQDLRRAMQLAEFLNNRE